MTRATTYTGTAAISVQSGGVNEAAVSKLMKTLGPNNPDLVQIASAALGYATNKLVGEDALAGAALAQWGSKWNKDSEDFILNVVGNALSTALEEKVIITLDGVVEEEKSRIDSEQINKVIEELREGIYVVD